MPDAAAPTTRPPEPGVDDAKALAVAELLGALTYGQLRAFEVTARAIRVAPDSRAADMLADFAAHEHGVYTRLRDRLLSLSDLSVSLMDRQKAPFDAYFDAVDLDDWISACAFFAFGLPLAADFIRAIAPTLDDTSAAVVLDSLAERDRFEGYAQAQVLSHIQDDDAAREHVRHLLADLLGRALTGFQAAVAGTDALEVLLAARAEAEGQTAEAQVRHLAIQVLEGHRRRTHAVGIDDALD